LAERPAPDVAPQANRPGVRRVYSVGRVDNVRRVYFYRDGAKAFETEPLAVSDGWNPQSKAVPID